MIGLDPLISVTVGFDIAFVVSPLVLIKELSAGIVAVVVFVEIVVLAIVDWTELDFIFSADVVGEDFWAAFAVIMVVDLFNEEMVDVADVSSALDLLVGVVLISSPTVDIVLVVIVEMGALEVLIEVFSVQLKMVELMVLLEVDESGIPSSSTSIGRGDEVGLVEMACNKEVDTLDSIFCFCSISDFVVSGESVVIVNETDVVFILEVKVEGFMLFILVELERVEIVSIIVEVVGMMVVNVVGLVSSMKGVPDVELDCLDRLVPVVDVTCSDSDIRLVLDVASTILVVMDTELPILVDELGLVSSTTTVGKVEAVCIVNMVVVIVVDESDLDPD